MQEQLLNHINRFALCKTTDKILLAVSGGLDSMVMLHLMRRAGYDVAVAHCNFQLRGEEALADEALVRSTCEEAGIPFFCKRFDTEAYATHAGVSIQMAARDLRYEWFEHLLSTQPYDLVATAHHYGDVVESVLLNLIRGTGIDGFRGITPKKDRIIRPLLFATRDLIRAYAEKEAIRWREDESNASDDYRRNFVRHHIIPRMEELNPSFTEGFKETQERLLGAREMMLAYLATFRDEAVEVVSGREWRIDLVRLQASPAPATVLWELIKDLGFKYDHCSKIIAVRQPGKVFHTPSHQLVVDRTHLIIERKQPSEFVTTLIEKGQRWAGSPPFLLLIREISSADFELIKDPALAQLDANRLAFPLVWRKWQAGDYFTPLGMRQEKKLSDFLIDLKIPFHTKADITVIESGNEIVWVVGFRINERFKVTPQTEKMLVLEQRQEQQ